LDLNNSTIGEGYIFGSNEHADVNALALDSGIEKSFKKILKTKIYV
jgi:hypothetical protein